jgi:hypothetical protein
MILLIKGGGGGMSHYKSLLKSIMVTSPYTYNISLAPV